MRVAVFSSKPYERISLETVNPSRGQVFTFLEPCLTPETASLASGFPAVCISAEDRVGAPALQTVITFEKREAFHRWTER